MNIIEGLGYLAVAVIAIAVLFFTQNFIIALVVAYIGCSIIFECTP